MKVQEFIEVLTDIGADAATREFRLWAYNTDDQGLAEVTGVIWSPEIKGVIICTDEL